MVGARRLVFGVTVLLAAFAGCTLTSSLDDLRGDASSSSNGGQGGSGIGTGDSGFPDGSGGNSAGGAAGSDGGNALDPPWWDPSWPKRVRLTIEAQSSTGLPAGFQVGVALDPAIAFGSSVSTYSMVRYDDVDQSWSELPEYVEQVGGMTWIWVKLGESVNEGAIDSSIWLYAGKSAITPDDPASVFELWEDFDAASSDWYASGSPSYSGGSMTLTNNASVRSKLQLGTNLAVDFSMRVDQPVSDQYDWVSAGFQRTSDFDNTEPWIIWVSREAATVNPEAEIAAIPTSLIGTSVALGVGQTVLYGIERFDEKAVYRRDHVTVEELAWSGVYNGLLQLRLSTQAVNAVAKFPSLRVRRASDPPPAVTLSAPETVP